MTALTCQCGECDPEQRFTCSECEDDIPWCRGNDDERPDLCDCCWAATLRMDVEEMMPVKGAERGPRE